MRPTAPAIVAVVLTAACLSTVASGQAATATTDPCAAWMDKAKTPDQRADALVGAMSTDQKLHMVTFSDPPWFLYYGTAGHISGIDELCVPDLVLSDAGSGVAGLQYGTTTFPSGVAQASMWDPEMQRAV